MVPKLNTDTCRPLAPNILYSTIPPWIRILSRLYREHCEIRNGPKVAQLLRVDHRTNGVNGPIRNVEGENTDDAILGIESHRSRLAVHFGGRDALDDQFTLGEDAEHQAGD